MVTMNRFIISIILGLILPFICFVGIGITTDYMTPSFLTEIKMLGESAPGLLLAPFSLPFYLDIFLQKNQILPNIFDTFLYRFSFFILFNWVLYGLIIYWVLGKLPRFKKNKIIFSEPPPPPSFEQRI